MSDFDTVKAAVVKTLEWTSDNTSPDWEMYLWAKRNDVRHMLPADAKCALCSRADCRGTACPFADVRQRHEHTILESRVREGAGEGADVFLCDTCDEPVCRAEWLDGHGWVREPRPREESETCDCPYGNPCDICGAAWSNTEDDTAVLREELTALRKQLESLEELVKTYGRIGDRTVQRLNALEANPIIRATTEDRS